MTASTKSSYFKVNLSLLAIFILAFLFFYFQEAPARCFYEKHYNYVCSTCGLTRDFKSILQFKFDGLINPRSPYYFGALLSVGFSRIIVLLLLKLTASLRRIILMDIVLLLMLMVFLFYVQFGK